MPRHKAFTSLGLMSGTSLDGIDGAFLQTDGDIIKAFGPSVYRAYTASERQGLEIATQAALAWQFKGLPPKIFSQAEAILHQAHIELIEALLADNPDWASNLDVIGFHGQTVLHHPAVEGKIGQTLQLGQGDKLSAHFGVDCVFDFRRADVVAGGQGAPLAPIYHQALCRFSHLSGISAVLNLGGVGNVSLVSQKDLWASDTGPANGPLDQWMKQHGHDYDMNGIASLAGQVDFTSVQDWLDHLAFFSRPLPRSADRYDFDVVRQITHMSLEDGAATLTAFAALAAAHSLAQMDTAPERIILCGGGRHNRAMRLMLKEACRVPVFTAEDMGWDSDMIEAQAFAYLAVRSLQKQPLSFPQTTGVSRPMRGGKISRCR